MSEASRAHLRSECKSQVSQSTLLRNAIRLAAVLVAAAPLAARAEAIVGETRTYAVSQEAASIETMKAEFRRPQAIPFPDHNPFTPAKAALGKKLYFDPRLSASSTQSCASCHNPALGWGDGLRVGVGHAMEQLRRRSPTLVNAAWGSIFMWDGRADSLESQALGPIQSRAEMDMPMDKLIPRLSSIRDYKPLFAAAFPNEGLSASTLTRAIATYERTIVSGSSPFDAWVEGDEQAISDTAKRGFVVFNTTGGCASCHSGWNFTDDGFHDIGLPSQDVGRGQFLPSIVKMQHAFKTPTLREIAYRAPYMHDGSLVTLEKVVEHYSSGGIARQSRSELVMPLALTSAQKDEIVQFLKSLSSTTTPPKLPTLPR